MKLSTYFENANGTGVLATADSGGRVNAALYWKPFFIDEETVAFLTAERVTRLNLQTNPHAAFLFAENETSGKRLYLVKVKEDQNRELEGKILHGIPAGVADRYKDLPKYVLYFRIEKVRPLVGDDE